MYYNGAKSHHVEAMKWATKILVLVSSLPFLTLPGATAEEEVITYRVKPDQEDRSGTSVVYACNVGKETGPCVDEPFLCTSQGGNLLGYCFFEGHYEGVCCTGLNPANSTLTTKRPDQEVNDDATTTAQPSFPTQTFPPAPTMTSDTLPPAPTMTTQSIPTSSLTTQTMPPAPTMTSDTMPPAPTMTTQSIPTSTLSTQTMPPAPTMTSDTMPTAPTMTTQSIPSSSLTTQTIPTAPTITTQSIPTSSLTTQTLPPAPTFPSQPGVNDDTTTAAPTAPSMPTMTTQTLPPAPTMTTQSIPSSTMTTQTMPPAPTMSTQTVPTAPAVPTETAPTAPAVPTETAPTAPAVPTETAPTAPTMTTQSIPSSSLTTQTMPPAPTMTTQTVPSMPTETAPTAPTMTTQTVPAVPTETAPTAPTMTTQSIPSSSLTTQTMPTAPTMTTQTVPSMPTETAPTAPTMTTQSIPSSSLTTQTMPTAPTAPQTPSVPTVPTTPQTPAPSSPPAHFDNSSSTHHTLFPTMSTQTFPTQNMNFTTQSWNFTTQTMNFTTQSSWNITTQSFNMTTHQMNFTTQSFPNFTMTTESMNFTTQQFNMTTMTTLAMPNITGPVFTTTETSATTTDTSTTESSTQASTQPSFDLPQDGAGCGIVSSNIQSIFQNPSYPSLDTEPNVYEYSVVPQDGFCALRIEFLESHLAGKGMEGCSVDSVVILNSVDTPTSPQCGLLQGYQFTVRQEPGQPVKIVVTTQSYAHLWNINATQIQCSSIRPYQHYETPDCGIKNPKEAPPGLSIHQNSREEAKSIAPTKLLKSRRKTLRDIMSDPSLAPSKLLQSAVLNRETNIKIVRGNETGINEYPWQALLMVNGRPLCGASILNEEWVITAGHCVQLNVRYPLVSVLTVDLGDHDLRTTKETKNVVSRISKIVPNVQNEGVRNDIALVKLATKIPLGKTIRAVCLPQPRIPPDTYAGRNAVTTGWGRTEDSVISPVLREASLPILSNEKCRQLWSSVGEGAGSIIDSGMVCAGGGEVGPCNGDNGGPLLVEEEGRHRLVGLTSFGLLRGCAVSGVPSVFARLSTYLDWIALNLADT